MDFTLKEYKDLLFSIHQSDYSIQTFEDFIKTPNRKVVVLRHDVDRLPMNAYKMAILESEMQVQASYYFRIVPHVYSERVIRGCVNLRHEVSYHYEDLTLSNGDIDAAYLHFVKKLELFRGFYPAETVCMHGSPLSKWDNREIWKKYDYKKLGIIAEPYFDVDYKKVLYITDTGRKWNKENVSIRDKVVSGFSIDIKSTKDLIKKFRNNELPDQIIINTHPHRWFNNFGGWVSELIIQNLKNTIKFIIVKRQ
jgi:hypothetical protein